MKIKFLCAVAALAVVSAAETAYADAPAPTPEFTISGDAAIVSQYRFRGITQTNNRPTAQMALTVTDASGFYISTWGSGSASADNGGTGGTEIDVYGGYSKTLKDGITLDGGLYGYLYPQLSGDDEYEVYFDASKSFGPITAKVGVNWAPKQAYFTYFDSGTHYSMYEYANLSYTPTKLPALTIHGEIGHTGGGMEPTGTEYIDYTVGAGYKWKALTFDLSLVGTNLTHADTGPSNFHYVKAEPVFSITANFP